MNPDKRAKLVLSAERAFRDMAPKAGIDSHKFEPTDHWIKKDKSRLHIVQKFEGKDRAPVIVRVVARPQNGENFDATVKAHQAACRALWTHETASVPAILATDTREQCYIMEYFNGETLVDLCLENKAHNNFLAQAGAWLYAYHGATFEQMRPFQPKFMLDHIARLKAKVAAGQRSVAEPELFVSYCEKLPGFVGRATSYVGNIAAKHGDFSAQNILINDHNVAAIDFGTQSNAPVAFDIARLLYSYMRMAGDLSKIPEGHVVPPQVLRAFFNGYKSGNADDPIVAFLLRVQILTDWNSAEKGSDLSAILRFERIKEIARIAFS